MPRIFISHASADDATIDRLSDWLCEMGLEDHFVDHCHIAAGESWDAVLRREAARAEMLILYVSPDWLASDECFAEYRASFYGDKTVLPLLVDGLRAQDLAGRARERFDTLCSSVQGIPVGAMPPDGFTAEQIEAAVSRVTRAARVARRQRYLARGGLVAAVLVATLVTLGVTNAAYVGDLIAKWQVDRSFAPASGTDEVFLDCKHSDLCPEMIALPAAQYEIGYASDFDPNAWESPVQPVEIPAFAVSKFEVTKSQWRACYLSSKRETGETPRCKELVYSEATRDEPVESVSWNDAQAYVAWLNTRLTGATGGPYRLLSEAEWEYAARGGTVPRETYSWGNGRQGICDHANMLNHDMPVELDVRRPGFDCSGATIDNHVRLAPVGSYKPNAFGLYDTAGNVSEWVADCWHDSHAGRPAGIGSGPWLTDAPKDCDRVLKGGSWIGHIDLLRPSARVPLSPETLGFNIGFRVGRALPE
ncbi:SUMF1/EgtB/PvdO family nonheme iron enzyme [Salipiger mucosus]|uniref:TIR domain-containing protein n=1 Tax=Salipiger mucosus DSM 16094 TaxID=1123237 RepID=S9QEH4_9RHOB|nr:SUMF1/EgtB/PvdO family nonheme iron enzyme [Salipiger mucosus]EPX78327.1 hypothetical protein Salmuc_03943 [Salipiger mucosus DSM 16094]